MLQAMATSKVLQDEIVRANMIKFRADAKLSQAEAADISGLPIDALRRYENGTTSTIPGTALAALGKAYGHAMEDFMLEKPPAAKLEERPVFFLRTRPDAEIDAETYRKLQDIIEKANLDAVKKKTKK